MSSRKQSFVGADGFEVLFDGSKSFWKTRTNLDILIASHKKLMCIEIVAYNAEVGVEAPRLYLSTMLLSTKINPQSEEFQGKVGAKKEALTRQKKTVNSAEITKEVYNEMMLNYILQRLGVVSEGVDLTKELKMTINPLTGDSTTESGTIDFVLEQPPTGLTPVVVTYTKKASASEISRAQHKLQSESAALKNATRLAELATSATENFRAVMEEQRRIAMEMRALSPARLWWIKAIRRVMTLNYIANAKIRLLNSSFAEWFKALMAKAEAEAAAEAEARAAEEKATALERESLARQRSILAANTSSKSSRSNTDRGKNKVARRSLDNSQLPSLSNIEISRSASTDSVKLGANAGGNASSLPQLGSPSAKQLPEKLLLDPMERRRQARAEREEALAASGAATSAKLTKIGKALSRKSFGGETELELSKFQAALAPSPLTEVSAAIASSGAGALPSVSAAAAPVSPVSVPHATLASMGRPPSLIESYSTKGAAFLAIPNILEGGFGESTKTPKAVLEGKSPSTRRARS